MRLSGNPRRLSLFALAILLCGATYASAQAGSLDPTFATSGIFTVPAVRGNALGVAIQSNGQIVVAGSGIDADGLVDTILRLNTDGTLDTTFGSGGIVTINNTGGFFAVAIQSNGEIVAAGSASGEVPSYVQVARFETNGSLDTSFGSGGLTTATAIPFLPITGAGNFTENPGAALALQPNGEILVAASNPGVMGRFTTSGQLDATFGNGGIVTLANVGPALANTASPSPTQIVVEKSGKILVAAGIPTPTPVALAGTLSRYNSDGSLDTTFGALGSAASVATPTALVLQKDGKIVVAGALAVVPPAANRVGFGLVRYNSAGMVDKTFGSGGVAVADFGTNAALSGAFALAIQSNGELVAAGAAAQGPFFSGFNSAFGLARFTTTGALDSSFGTGGLVMTTLESGSSVYSYVAGMAIQSDGKIVAAGSTIVDEGFDHGAAQVARYLAQ
jgi:uncharacterized delta-60 repeat protein